MQTVTKTTEIKIPQSVAVCPICGAEVYITGVEEWEQMDDGTWAAGETGVHIDCVSAPPIDSRKWREWFKWHWSMPYVYWMPLRNTVTKWVRDNYRFVMN